MKQVIISFILFVIYDSYMRQKDKTTPAVLPASTSTNKQVSSSSPTPNVDLSEIYYRLQQLEKSPYA